MSNRLELVNKVKHLVANKAISAQDLEDMLIFAGGKGTLGSFLDENNNPIAIKCGYFKRWMLVDEVEFGVQRAKGHHTGRAGMCKVGARLWVKSHRGASHAVVELLYRARENNLSLEELYVEFDELERQKKVVDLSQCPKSYDTLLQALEQYYK